MEFSSIVAPPVDLSAEIGTVRAMALAARARRLPAPVGRIGREELRARVHAAMARGLPTSLHCVNTAKEWAVIGGGPSINDHVDTIRKLKRRGVAIVSVNKTHDWLLGHGIVPWGHVLLDPKDWVAGYVTRPRKDVRYFVASQCHGDVFDALKDFPVFLWHAGQDFPEERVSEPDGFLRECWAGSTWQVVPGATTVGLRAPMLGHSLQAGVDRFHMIGFDSSRAAGKLHGYAKPEAIDAASGLQKIVHRGKKYCFDTNSHMARQFVDFDQFMGGLEDHYAAGRLRRGFRMTFYGRGLLPFYAAMLGLHADAACNSHPVKAGGFVRVEDAG